MTDALLLAHSPETHRAIAEAYRKHGSIRKTARAVNLPKSTVHDSLRRQGIETAQGGMTPVGDLPDSLSPAKGEAEQSDEMARELQERSATPEENPEPLPTGTPPLPQDVSPMDLESLQDPQERQTPSHRLYLEAIYRYVNCLANGVHPLHAERAAASVDPMFTADPEDTERWQDLLERAGYNPRALPLSERPVVWLFASPTPPSYVQSMFDDYAMDSGDIQDLADLIAQIRETAYLNGINEQLTTLNRDPLPAITDPSVLAEFQQDAMSAAQQIADTYNRDLAAKVGSAWLDAASNPLLPAGDFSGVVGGWAGAIGQQREAAMQTDIEQWLEDRADWKAQSIATTEAAGAYADAVMSFAQQNGGQTVHVEPDECQCSGCQDLVDLGDIPMDAAAAIDLPLHVGCYHGLVATYDPASVPDDLWLPVADAGEAAGQTG